MDDSTSITVPGVVTAAGVLHRAKASRPELERAAERMETLLRATPEDNSDHPPLHDAWTRAVDACTHNSHTRIRAAVMLVEAAKLELLTAVYDAAVDDEWSLRDLAAAAGTSRGTISNVLAAGGVKTARAADRDRSGLEQATG